MSSKAGRPLSAADMPEEEDEDEASEGARGKGSSEAGISDEVKRQLVGELRSLETLRQEHFTLHPGSLLERDDPDVQRLIEALALFSVRTKMSLQRNLEATWRRLFSSYFDFMLAQLPSCAIIQAVISPRLVETLTVERGTEVRVETKSGKTALFTTLDELSILPIALESVEERQHSLGSKLLLRFTSRYPRTDAVGRLRLFISAAGHYESALRMLYEIRSHLKQVTVAYDPGAETGGGPPCSVSYGALCEPPLDGAPENPVESVRRFFHFPERELYLNIEVPRSEQPWSAFVLTLELGTGFSPESQPGRDTFQLFTVPVENCIRQPAAQITCDGTQAGYALRHVEPAQKFSLLRVRGVSRRTEKGFLPLRPATLSAFDGEESFEIEVHPDSERREPCLIVRMPHALLKPVKLHAICDWHQPWFAAEAVGKLGVVTPQYSLDGVSLFVLGPIHPAQASPMQSDTQGLLLLLALRMKPVLGKEELLRVLEVLGISNHGAYRRISTLLRELKVEAALDSALRGSGLRHVYTASMESYAANDEPLVWHFLKEVHRLLDAWNAEASVELVLHTKGPALKTPLDRSDR